MLALPIYINFCQIGMQPIFLGKTDSNTNTELCSNLLKHCPCEFST